MFWLAGVMLASACDSAETLSAPQAAAPAGAALASLTAALPATGPGPMASGVAANVCADVRGGTDRAPADGAPVQAWACHGGANQQFVLQTSGAVTAYNGARCLDVWGAKANDRDPVVAWSCHGGANQRWTRTAAGELRSAVNGKCLDLWGARAVNGAALVVYSCHGGSNQKWAVRTAAATTAPTPVAPPQPADSTAAPAPAVPPGEAPAPAAGAPELPRVYLDTRMPATTGRTIAVAAGGNLQAALDAALPGDAVVLAPGATFVGNFVLRAKAGMTAGQWITVRTGGTLPAEGTRARPADAAQMPDILTPNSGPALRTEPRAQGWRVTGVEVGAASQAPLVYALVALGSAGSEQSTLTQVPSRIVLDRSYVHGRAGLATRRCVALNSAASAVVDSYLDECHERGPDSQAILGWNGPGPFKIVNNYLAGAGENVMFGGGDPSIPNLVPADIEIRNNDFVKPPSWKGVWTVKNSFELKNARRVLVERNRFEGSWSDGQTGPAIVFKSANQDGACTWCVTEHVTFRHNRIRNVGAGFVVSGQEGRTVAVNHVLVAHNLLELMNTGVYDGANRQVQIGGMPAYVTFDHNTFLTPGANQLIYLGSLGAGFRFTNNLGYHGQYGVMMDGNTWATSSLAAMAPSGYTFAGNAVIGTSGANYPSGNMFPTSETAAAGLRGTDGALVGADRSKLP